MGEVALEETVPAVAERRGGRKRTKIPLETLKEEGSSFLSLGEDPLLKRLEMVRLSQQGYSLGSIGEAFGYSPQGVWAVVQRFREDGVEGLIEKRGGPYHSKVTPELEREILRHKALHPQLGDAELAAKFGLNRITIYNLLREHGLQDLHRVIEAEEEEGEKKNAVELIPCEHALGLCLVPALEMLGFQETLEAVGFEDLVRYTGQSLAYCFLFMQAFGLYRNSYLNSQDRQSFGVILGATRRPDQDTTWTYLKRLAEKVDPQEFMVEACRHDIYSWLHRDPCGVWYIDGHVVESFTEAAISKKRHGTKNKNVKAVEKYSLHSGQVEFSLYTDETRMVEVIKQLVELGDQTFPEEVEVVAFDKGGSCYDLFDWFDQEKKVFITWLENNRPNQELLDSIPDEEFVPWEGKVGKGEEEVDIVGVADVEQELKGKLRRLIVCQRLEGGRFALVTNAPWLGPLTDRKVLSGWKLLEVMRYKQRLENSFRLSVHEMGGNVIPDRCIEVETEWQPYELEKEEKKLERSQKKLSGLEQKQQEKKALWEGGELSKGEYNVLSKDIARQRKNLEDKIEKLEAETTKAEVDEAGQTFIAEEKSRLDTTRMGLLEVFKKYAIGAMAIVATLMGLAGMGPEKLRRVFLERGGTVAIDEAAMMMWVIANPFPSRTTQLAYERLCWELNKREAKFKRAGKEYTLKFTWMEKWEEMSFHFFHPI